MVCTSQGIGLQTVGRMQELPKDIERNGRLRILDLGSNNLQRMTSLQVLMRPLCVVTATSHIPIWLEFLEIERK